MDENEMMLPDLDAVNAAYFRCWQNNAIVHLAQNLIARGEVGEVEGLKRAIIALVAANEKLVNLVVAK